MKTEVMSGQEYGKFSRAKQRGIRNLEREDLDEVSRMFQREYPARDAMDLNHIYAVIPKLCFAFEKDEKIVGVVMNHLRGKAMHLKEIAVDRAHRGKGIGRNLVAKSLSESKKFGAKSADVNSRDKTVGFYTALGWTPTGIWEHYIIRDLAW